MDEVDIAQEQEMAARAEALRLVAVKPKLALTGFCHNCGEAIGGFFFCDDGCSKDYDKRQKFAVKTKTRFDCDPLGDREAFDRSPVREVQSEPRGEYDAQTLGRRL